MSNEELVIRIQNGEVTLMDELYEQVKGLLCSVCRRYRFLDDPEDLEQEAVLGLYAAVDNYDPARGTLFSSYLVKCVKNHIIRYVSGIQHDISLDEEQNEDGLTLADMLMAPDDIEGDAIDHADAERLSKALWSAVDDLDEKSATVIRGYFKDGKTFRNLSKELNWSYDTVLRLREKGLRDLKHSRRLRPYREELSEIYGSGLRGNGVQHFQRTWTSSTEATAIRILERG